MARLTAAEDGWINLIPRPADSEEQPTSLGFFTLLGGGGSGVTMCTWIPETHDRRGPRLPSLGITHNAGRRAVPELGSLGVVLPATWLVEQDHPRRGLVVRLPAGEAEEQVLEWALLAVNALGSLRPISDWQAEVHLPVG